MTRKITRDYMTEFDVDSDIVTPLGMLLGIKIESLSCKKYNLISTTNKRNIDWLSFKLSNDLENRTNKVYGANKVREWMAGFCENMTYETMIHICAVFDISIQELFNFN